MNIPTAFEQQQKPGDKNYISYLSQVLIRFWGYLAKVVNGGIELYYAQPNGSLAAGNVKGTVFRGNLSAGPNSVSHDLGHVPTGFVVLSINANTNLWYGGGSSTQVTINASAACNATVLII